VPIITRDAQGIPVPEVGAGGGYGDLIQDQLELLDADMVDRLKEACSEVIKDPEVLANVQRMLSSVSDSKDKTLKLEELASAEDEGKKESILLKHLIQVLSKREDSREMPSTYAKQWKRNGASVNAGDPKYEAGRRPEIQFPYSRHSSYSELCALVEAFKPKDIHPCTVDETAWTEKVSMQALFGHHCSGDTFAHDEKMYEKLELREGFPERKRVKREDSPGNKRGESQRVDETLITRYRSETMTVAFETARLDSDVHGALHLGPRDGLLLGGVDATPSLGSNPKRKQIHLSIQTILDPEGTLDKIRTAFGEASQGQPNL
jgi:DNA cross-link repair 1C protein